VSLPVLAGQNSAIADGTSITLTKPAGVVADDLLILIVGDDADNITAGTLYAPPAGWTLLAEAGGANDAWVAAFYRIADTTEGASETVQHSSTTDELYGWYLHVTGTDPTNPIHVVGTQGSSTNSTLTIPGLTTTKDDCLVFYMNSFDGADGFPFSVSGTGWTEQGELESPVGGAGNDASGSFGTLGHTTKGATADATVTAATGDGQYGIQFAISAPANVGDGDATLGLITGASTGINIQPVAGTASTTLGLISASAAGAYISPVSGTASTTLGLISASAIGLYLPEDITGTGDATIPLFSGSASGINIQPIVGDGDATLGLITGASTGINIQPIVGDGAGITPLFSGDAEGLTSLPIAGYGAGILSLITGDATGNYIPEPITGTASTSLGLIIGSATGINIDPIAGTASTSLGLIIGSASGTFMPAPIIGTGAATITLSANAEGIVSKSYFVYMP